MFCCKTWSHSCQFVLHERDLSGGCHTCWFSYWCSVVLATLIMTYRHCICMNVGCQSSICAISENSRIRIGSICKWVKSAKSLGTEQDEEQGRWQSWCLILYRHELHVQCHKSWPKLIHVTQLSSCFSTDFERSKKTVYILNTQQANKWGNTIRHAVFTQQIKFIGGSRVKMLSDERNPEHSCGFL